MPSFFHYNITDTITSGRLTFQRALSGEKRVLLCSHPREGERDAGQRRAVKEYRLLQSLNEPALLKPIELIEAETTDVIVFEDPGGLPVEKLKLHRSLSLLACMQIAVKLAEIVQRLHDRKILHLGLSPSCIFYSDQDIRIGDLSRSSRLDRLESEQQAVLPGDSSIVYLPPEQTGLVHRPIDLRSDLYSLGAVLYFLFTGRPPFTERDPSILVHRIIATPPDPIDSVDVRLPAMLSAVLIKALAKDPDDRYRSVRGLIADLQRCVDAMRAGEPVTGFQPGQADKAEEFRLPSTIYGREEQLALLHTLYQQTTHGNKNVLILEGQQGMGRTSLVLEMQRDLSLRGAFFARGRPSDQGAASMLRAAIEPLLRKILALPENELSVWKDRIRSTINENHAALLSLFPSLEWITGRATLPVEPAVIRQQWITGCRELLKVLSTPEAPMLLFLDDCHLADQTGMEILSALIEEPEPQSILIVLSFRAENIPPLTRSLIDGLERSCQYVRRMSLPPISLQATERMLADLFSDSVDEERSLAALIHRKTGGNPFYIRELLLLSRERGWISYDRSKAAWIRDLEKIEQSDVSANVVNLLSQRISDLDEEERQLLQFASIIGEVFDLFTLYWVSGWTPRRILSVLRHLYDLEFIRPESASFSAFEGLSEEEADETLFSESRLSFRFAHERIRKAAYQSMEAPIQKRLHAYAGIHLLEFGSREPGYFERHLFKLVGHLNSGREYLEELQRSRLAALNLQAGTQALAGGDPESALSLFRAGLLDSHLCDTQTEFDLKLQTARAEALSGSPAASESLFRDLYARTSDSELRLSVYRTHIPLLTLYNRYEQALERGRKALEEFGPIDAADVAALTESLIEGDILPLLRSCTGITSIIDFRRYACLQILDLMAFPASVADDDLFNGITVQSLTIIRETGLTPGAPAVLARLVRVLLPDYDLAQELATIAARWLTEHEALRTTENLYWFSLFAAPLTGFEDCVSILEEAVRSGYENGEIDGAARSIVSLCMHQFFTGQPLQTMQTNIARHISILKRQRQEDPLLQLSLWNEAIATIMDRSSDPVALTGADFSESEIIPMWSAMQNHNALMQFYFLTSLTRYLNEEMDGATSHIDSALKHRAACRGTILEAACLFLDTLILHRKGVGANEFRLRRNVAELRLFAYHAPRYYGIWYGVVEALAGLHEGRRAEAVYGLEESLSLAIERNRLLDRALIEDLLFDLYRFEGKKSQEILYFTDALTAYRLWGGRIRLKRLVEISRENANILLTRIEDLHGILRDPEFEPSVSADSRTLIEASAAIASEITLEGVIRTILGLIVRLSGSESALFLYRRHGQLRVVASADASGQVRYDAAGTDPFAQATPIPSGMLLFALRTGKTVIEHNAFESGDYRNDPYVQSQRLRSVLCLPLQRQGEAIGMLYLENRLTGHVFHPGRTELLRQLSGQMAVSLVNADHYESLEEQIRNRTRSLEESLSQVERLKQQQDVDYYLISILLRPLLQNETQAERFDISFLIRQKKRFRFKRWMVEIGGDLCFGADLTLRGRRYSILVNGDGMGKSLQGSGGALVLGSVLKALVERTRLNSVLQDVTPADWLLQAMREIHQVFATFNGLMFVTVILSLLDEESGTLHFVNGGHPKPVLYRRGKASYFGEKIIVHKPGMKFFQASPENVEFIRFDPGDVVFFGSDGRDDLIVDYDAGHPVINEDESVFLRVVEEADGKTSRIYKRLRRIGELSDDITLIRIAAP